MKPRELISFLGDIEKLKCNTRHSWTKEMREELRKDSLLKLEKERKSE